MLFGTLILETLKTKYDLNKTADYYKMDLKNMHFNLFFISITIKCAKHSQYYTQLTLKEPLLLLIKKKHKKPNVFVLYRVELS